MPRTITVFSATGTFGVPTIRHLLNSEQNVNLHIRAFCRDQTGNEFRKLQDMTDNTSGMQFRGTSRLTCIKGDLNKPEETINALRDADCCVLILNPFVLADNIEEGSRLETSIGRRIISECIECGVRDFVYLSVCDANEREIPFFWSKKLVEDELRRNEASFRSIQIIRPVYLIDNLELSHNIKERLINDHVLALPVSPQTKLPLICADDVGLIVCDCALDPHKLDLHEKILEPCSEILSVEEMASVCGVSYQQAESHHFPQHLLKMYQLFEQNKVHPSPDFTHKQWPNVLKFEQWSRSSFVGAEVSSRREALKETEKYVSKAEEAGGIV
ncbi:hypothetical protein RCL1_004625 [Eukaryota sp. TZLM3-RCL]